jgi:hypothetical protein
MPTLKEQAIRRTAAHRRLSLCQSPTTLWAPQTASLAKYHTARDASH